MGCETIPPLSANSSLCAERALVDFDSLLPFIEGIGEDEVGTARTAIDYTISEGVDRGNVPDPDMSVAIDPHGGAKVVFREELVARSVAMPAAKRN